MYRRIFTRATVSFSVASLVGRLPISMIGLGIVLLAQHTTGSYAVAGSLSAAAMIANAVFAIPQGRLVDRLGQGVVLRVAITVWGAGLAGAMASLESDWPRWTAYVLAAVSGAALPSVGTCARARWAHTLAGDESALHTAFSFEAAVDEVVFIIGPVAVTLLATGVDPIAGLAAALLAGLAGTYGFASLRGSEPPAHPRSSGSAARAPIPWAAIGVLTVQTCALGVLFGAAEVVTVAFAQEHGHASVAGLLLACWSTGSLVAGLLSGVYAGRVDQRTMLWIGALGMSVSSAPLVWIPSIPWMAVALLIGGVTISPTMIAAMSLAKQALPSSRMTEGMAFLNTGLALGVAPGAAVAGIVIDAHGASSAYLVCVAGSVIALLAALAVRMPTNVGEHERAEQLA
ncbi:MFS transporter [Nocardioides ultimimeridianus]